jgi:PAS domain S-box-containing protein
MDGEKNSSAAGEGTPPELREHLRWLRETIPGFSYRCLPEPPWTVLRLTEGIEDLTGHPADSFVQNPVRSFASIIHPGDRASVLREIERAVQRRAPYFLEYRLLHRDGSIRWVSERGRAVCSDEKVAWLDGHVVDQTEIRQMRQLDEQRREAVARQQAALVSLVTSDAVATGDLEEASKLATELVAEAVNVERASVWLLGEGERTLELVNLFRRSERAHSAEVCLKSQDYPSYFDAMQTGRLIDAGDAQSDPRTCEFRDGYLKPLGITSMLDVALRVSGRVSGVLCLEHIGEARTWTDQDIRFAGEVADQLAHALLNRERYRAQVREADLQEQLFFSQKMEAIGQLAGSVAHDFNNLLTVISGFAESLKDTLTDSVALDDVEEIAKAARQGTELTAQLLSMSRRDPVELKRVDLAKAVQELSKMFPKMLAEDIALTVHLPEEPMFVRSSLGLTQQILTNLIVNAGHAISGRGAIAISLRTLESSSPVAVERGELPPGKYAALEVSDSGKGMSAEVKCRIFEPFFTTRPQGFGTGLGLSTVYNIVQRCAGGISVHSTPDVGSRFTVFLPFADRGPVEVTAVEPARSGGPWAKGLHFLIVEDNIAVLGVMQNALNRLGARVTTATRPDEAIGILEKWAEREISGPHLILTDMGMPGGGGGKVIHWVRANRPEVPIAVVSGYIADNQSEAVEGLEFLRKPFLSADLQNFVRDVLLGQRA